MRIQNSNSPRTRRRLSRAPPPLARASFLSFLCHFDAIRARVRAAVRGKANVHIEDMYQEFPDRDCSNPIISRQFFSLFENVKKTLLQPKCDRIITESRMLSKDSVGKSKKTNLKKSRIWAQIMEFKQSLQPYKKSAILHCLHVQIGWYTGTLVRYQCRTKCAAGLKRKAERATLSYPCLTRGSLKSLLAVSQ